MLRDLFYPMSFFLKIALLYLIYDCEDPITERFTAKHPSCAFGVLYLSLPETQGRCAKYPSCQSHVHHIFRKKIFDMFKEEILCADNANDSHIFQRTKDRREMEQKIMTPKSQL